MSQPYKKGATKVCKFFLQGHCRNARCPFLHSKQETAATGSSSGVMTTLLRLLFQKQQHSIYDPTKGLVNVSNLKACEDLKDVTSAIDFNTAAFCDALCSVIKETVSPPPAVLALDNNSIRSLGHFLKALETHGLSTFVTALSARENAIGSNEFLGLLRNFTSLQELALNGNPVTQTDNYRNIVKKALPQLVGLDMRSVEGVPLGLPWPTFEVKSELDASRVLAFVESFVRAGVDSLPDFYAVDASFTFLSSDPSAVVAFERGEGQPNRDLVREIISMKLCQNDQDHNITKGIKSSAFFRGRTMVCSKLAACIYGNFNVYFDVHPCPQVTFVSSPSVAVVTVHGYIYWAPKGSADTQVKRRFSRTLAVQADAVIPDRFMVANDMLLLYPFDESVLFDSCSKVRLEKFARKTGVELAVVEAVASLADSDASLTAVLQDIKGIPMSVLEECVAVGGSTAAGISISRIVGKLRSTPQQALELFNGIGCDPARLREVM